MLWLQEVQNALHSEDTDLLSVLLDSGSWSEEELRELLWTAATKAYPASLRVGAEHRLLCLPWEVHRSWWRGRLAVELAERGGGKQRWQLCNNIL